VKNDFRMERYPEIVYNAVVFNESKENKNAVSNQFKDKFVIGLIGNMGKQYNFDVVIEVAEELQETNCCFVFLGEGSQKRYLENIVSQRGLKNVQFYNAVPVDEVDHWIKQCDLTLISMKEERLYEVYIPLKALDSLKNGVPVIFGGYGEVSEFLLNNKAGAVFKPRDKEKLSELIIERLNDRELLNLEGENGHIFIKNFFTRYQMGLKYLQIFHDIAYQN
jgi:glycosyltransferase involved in cell wall biosynthesis